MEQYDNIINNISEGILTIGFDGVITHANPAAIEILRLKGQKVEGERFAAIFFEDHDKDDFVQTILEAVYDKENPHHFIVPYGVDGEIIHLRIMTSFYKQEDEKKGIIAAFSDLSELMELRDAVKSMEQIQALNSRLEMRNRLLSETFGRYLSDDIVQQLLEAPSGLSLGGRKRTLTIMMSDLRGFTAMSERMDATSLISMLNNYLGAMTEVIQAHHGTIIEFIGDGIMAIFGAPTASDKHAQDAVAAALTMQSAMDKVNSWNKKRGYPMLEMGIGLNTGEVIVGNIGSKKRTKYGVVGSNVNLCGRIESYTVGGQVLIPPSTREACKTRLTISDTMTVRPKGVKDELKLYLVTGIGEPYNVRLNKKKTELPPELKTPIDIDFRMIEDKHESGDTYKGQLTALSGTHALLVTDEEPELLDNIEFEAGGPLFAKIMSRENEAYLLHFTSVPPGFDEWKSGF